MHKSSLGFESLPDYYFFKKIIIMKQKKHLQSTVDKTKCGIKVTKDNLVIDINACTCKKCKAN